MTDNEWFEIKAAAFYTVTGFMAPGKDISAAANLGEDYREEQTAAWMNWTLANERMLWAIRRALEDSA